MRLIRKLGRRRRGAGSIIGAVFMPLIFMTSYTFFTLKVNVMEEYVQTIQNMQQLDLKRNQERIEFITVFFKLASLVRTSLIGLQWMRGFKRVEKKRNEMG